MANQSGIAEFSRRHRVWAVLIGVLVLVVLLAAFISLRRAEVPVHVAAATRDSITSAISTNGKIEPVQNFEAHAPAGTTVKHMLVHEGDHVRRGQLLLQLDDSQARAQAAKAEADLKAAEAEQHATQSGGTREEVLTNQAQLIKAQGDLDAAKRNLDALERLQLRGAASNAEVEAAVTNVQAAQAQVNLLQQKKTSRYSRPEMEQVQARSAQARAALLASEDLLRNSNITAGIDGTVYSLPIRQGAFVNQGDLLVQVADLSRLQVRAFVDEPDIGRLATGEKVSISWDGLPGRTWDGKVMQVPTTVIVRGTRNVGEIIASVDNVDGKLLPNLNVNVVITAMQHSNVLTVPREAVHQENGKSFVFEVVNGQLKHRDVQTGVTTLTRIEITGGLSDGALVAIGSGNDQPLRDGLPVRVER